MSRPDRLKIACYMGGAEATFAFSNKEAYDKARASLAKIAVAHAGAEDLPPGYSNVTDLYFIDVKDRDVFNQIMDTANSKQA
jgi:hypothetical protein